MMFNAESIARRGSDAVDVRAIARFTRVFAAVAE